MADLSDLTTIFVLGAPGVGKGTLCKRLCKEQPYFHFSNADHLRRLRDKAIVQADQQPNATTNIVSSISTEELQTKLKARELVNDESIVAIVKHRLADLRAATQTKILIDGFPRTEESARLFDQQVGPPAMVLSFIRPRKTAQWRFLERGRETDDDVAAFVKRFDEFERENVPILKRYQTIVREVDNGTGSDDLPKAYPQLLQHLTSLSLPSVASTERA